MWVRTECGKLIDMSKVYGYVKYGYYWNNDLYEKYKIKKQGDNLIDVLEVDDIVIYGVENFSGSIMSIAYGEIYISDDTWFNPNKVKINKVITHEQYMPLAQEIK